MAQYNIPRTESQSTKPPSSHMVILVPQDPAVAPTTRELEHLEEDLGVNRNAIVPGVIERPTGPELPADRDVDWVNGRIAATDLFDGLTFGEQPDHVSIEMQVKAAGGGTAPVIRMALVTPDGDVASNHIIIDADGKVRYYEFEVEEDVGSYGLVIDTQTDGTDSGTVTFHSIDILGFAGSSPAARLVAQVADRLINIDKELDVGITQEEAINLINQLVPPEQRIPPLAGHGGTLVVVAKDASGIHLVDPSSISEQVAASWAQPGDPEPDAGRALQVQRDLSSLPPVANYEAGDTIVVNGHRKELVVVQEANIRDGYWSTVEVATATSSNHWKGVAARDAVIAPQCGEWGINPNDEVLLFGFEIQSETSRGPLQVAIRQSSLRAALGRDEVEGDKVTVSIIWATDSDDFELTWNGHLTLTWSGDGLSHERYIVFEAALQPPGIVFDGEHPWLKSPANSFQMLVYRGPRADIDNSKLILQHSVNEKHWADWYDAREIQVYQTGVLNAGRLDLAEAQIRQLQDHPTPTVVDSDRTIHVLDQLPHPTEAMPARAVVRVLPNVAHSLLTYVSRQGGTKWNGYTFKHVYDAGASPVSVTVVDKVITIGFGPHTHTIRQWADAIAAVVDFPSTDWEVDPFYYANTSVQVTDSMQPELLETANGMDAPTEEHEYVRLEERYHGIYDGGGDGWSTPAGLYRLTDYPDGLAAGRFRCRMETVNGYTGVWVAADYPPSGGLGHNLGEMIFDPTPGDVAGMYMDHEDGFWDGRLILGQRLLFSAMVDRVRYIWATVDDHRKRGDEQGGGVIPVVANPHEFNPDEVIHNNLVVSAYAPDGTRLFNQIAWNVTGQHIDIGGKNYRIFETLVNSNILAPLTGYDYVDIEIALDVDHAIKLMRDWSWPMAQRDWSDPGVKNWGTVGATTRTRCWTPVDIWHPGISAINSKLNNIAARFGGLNIRKISAADYDALSAKDPKTLYFTYGTDQSSRRIYIGADRWE